MQKLSVWWAKAKVIAKAAPTWLIGASAALVAAAHEISELVGDPSWLPWVIKLSGWLGAAGMVIRRVTPVPKDQRGLLPPEV